MKNLVFFYALFVSAASFGQNLLQNECADKLTGTAGKMMQLAETIPEVHYSWAPQENVRDVAGVLKHTISANYFFATKLVASLPAGVNMEKLDANLQSKADLDSALKQSSDLIVEAIKNVDENTMGNKVEFPFPGQYTTTTAVLIALTHLHEHLGQLIAYGRANEITPPWSN